jgi:hypothetical protein
VPEIAPGRIDGRVVPTATRGAAPSARSPGLETIAPPIPNRALSTPVTSPSSRVRASRSGPASIAAAYPFQARNAAATSGLASSSRA